jgi:hypothetical protein
MFFDLYVKYLQIQPGTIVRCKFYHHGKDIEVICTVLSGLLAEGKISLSVL